MPVCFAPGAAALASVAQVKFIIDDQLLKKFKQIVIKKRGRIELTPEGDDAIRPYIEKYRGLSKRGPGIASLSQTRSEPSTPGGLGAPAATSGGWSRNREPSL
jgi:hypothetical protein